MADAKETCWVGFDLGGTKMMATVYDHAFEVLGRKRKKTKGHEGAEAGLDRITRTIKDALDDAKVDRKQLGGIGVGCPGPLDLDRGVILDTPNLGWQDVKIAAALEDAFGCPVRILNDVDAGVYGEYRFGAGIDARCLVGVFPGTGIGGGCVYEGKIIRGQQGSCLEIGHLPVIPNGPLCGCGQYGCLEAQASRLAIAAQAAQAAYRGEAPHLLDEVGTDVAKIRSGVLADSIKAGDTAVEQIVRQAARHIGVAVAGVVNLLAPDRVVLGGGLVEAMPELFREEVRQAAEARVLKNFLTSFKVMTAKLGDDAGVLGAAAWVADQTAKAIDTQNR